MKLSALLSAYGDERVEMHNLDQSALSLDMNKNGTKITFGTPQRLNLKGTEKLGLVIWLDRDEVKKLMDAETAR